MSASALQTSVYEGLLNHLTVVLELAQKAEGVVSPQAKQVLLNATNDFKNAISRAKDTASNLPGGEMLTEEQDEVLAMLIKLRDQKRFYLLYNRDFEAIQSTQSLKTHISLNSPVLKGLICWDKMRCLLRGSVHGMYLTIEWEQGEGFAMPAIQVCHGGGQGVDAGHDVVDIISSGQNEKECGPPVQLIAFPGRHSLDFVLPAIDPTSFLHLRMMYDMEEDYIFWSSHSQRAGIRFLSQRPDSSDLYDCDSDGILRQPVASLSTMTKCTSSVVSQGWFQENLKENRSRLPAQPAQVTRLYSRAMISYPANFLGRLPMLWIAALFVIAFTMTCVAAWHLVKRHRVSKRAGDSQVPSAQRKLSNAPRAPAHPVPLFMPVDSCDCQTLTKSISSTVLSPIQVPQAVQTRSRFSHNRRASRVVLSASHPGLSVDSAEITPA